jgi:hypothetical protein
VWQGRTGNRPPYVDYAEAISTRLSGMVVMLGVMPFAVMVRRVASAVMSAVGMMSGCRRDVLGKGCERKRKCEYGNGE